MHPNNCIPVTQRVDLASRMIAHQGKYGLVSQLSRESNISRQSLYTLKSRGQAAMERVFRTKQEATERMTQIEQAVLILFTEGEIFLILWQDLPRYPSIYRRHNILHRPLLSLEHA